MFRHMVWKLLNIEQFCHWMFNKIREIEAHSSVVTIQQAIKSVKPPKKKSKLDKYLCFLI
jgi:hypothetical protein